MKLKQLLKSKSGVALENTLLFMLVIFSLCALLTSLTLTGFFQTRINKITLLNEVELEQIGEDYLSHVKSKSENENENEFTMRSEHQEKYACSVEGDVLSVWHKDDQNAKVVLLVEARITNEGQLTVVQWRYSQPAQATPTN
ncbi:MAG: hypothetical protein IJB94_00795 [Clostridia bacterium]|nr:hypothetical protein [Clostridia bacterium]